MLFCPSFIESSCLSCHWPVSITIVIIPAATGRSLYISIWRLCPVCPPPHSPVSGARLSCPLCHSGLWPSVLPFSELNQSHSMCIFDSPVSGARLSCPLCHSGVSHKVQSRDPSLTPSEPFREGVYPSFFFSRASSQDVQGFFFPFSRNQPK